MRGGGPVARKIARRGHLPQRRSRRAGRGRDRFGRLCRSFGAASGGRAALWADGPRHAAAAGAGDASDCRHAPGQPDLRGDGAWPAAARGRHGGSGDAAGVPIAGPVGHAGIGRLRPARVRRRAALGGRVDSQDLSGPRPPRGPRGVELAGDQVCQDAGGRGRRRGYSRPPTSVGGGGGQRAAGAGRAHGRRSGRSVRSGHAGR